MTAERLREAVAAARAEAWDEGAAHMLAATAPPFNPDEWPFNQNPYRTEATP